MSHFVLHRLQKYLYCTSFDISQTLFLNKILLKYLSKIEGFVLGFMCYLLLQYFLFYTFAKIIYFKTIDYKKWRQTHWVVMIGTCAFTHLLGKFETFIQICILSIVSYQDPDFKIFLRIFLIFLRKIGKVYKNIIIFDFCYVFFKFKMLSKLFLTLFPFQE